MISIIANLYFNILYIPFWNYDNINNSQKTTKSLNNFMALFANHYLQASLIIISIVFYRIGPSVFCLMDSESFKNIYRSRNKSLHVMAIIVLIIFLDQVEFILFNPTTYIENQTKFWTLILKIFIDYYICVSYYITLFILNYVKFATIEMLKTISATRSEEKNVKTIIKKIGEMATLNRKISTLLSPMFLIFLFSSSLDMIVLFMWFTDGGWDFIRLFFASLTTWFYIAYLVCLDNQIIQIFQKTSTNLLENNLFECCGHCCNDNRMVKFENIHKKMYFCKQKQRIIECYRQYEEDFYMNIYDFCRIDYQFILDSFLFILIFVVISLQT